jgi:hypothetical protein
MILHIRNCSGLLILGWEGAVAYVRSVLQAGSERYFTVTENGRLGWLPMSIQTGDRIAILYGSRMPWVI